MTWSTGRTPTWAGPRSGRCPEADSCTLASCPSARCRAPGWSRGRCPPTPSPAPHRSRGPLWKRRPDGPSWSSATRRRSSKAGSRCGRTGPRSWSSSAATNSFFRPPRPRNGSTPTTGTSRKPRSPGSLPGAGPGTSPAWTCPPSSSRPNSPTPTPSASSTTRPTGSTSIPSTGCCATCSPTRRSPPTSGTRGALRGYLRSDTIAPLPLQRLAAAHPDTVDSVYRKILRRRDFTWAEHGEALMRRRKAWYYQHEPRPGVSVIGARLLELASGGRR